MKKGILVVSFGSSHKRARQNNINRIEEEIAAAYPEIPCYSAFTSDVIRGILERRDGIAVMGVEQALLKMKRDGITQVYLLPTHIIDGIENHKVKEIVSRLLPEFERIIMAEPLLRAESDYEQAVQGVLRDLGEAVSGRILILMGHGSEHAANHSYERLEQAFRKAGHENVFLATVEAGPSIEDVIEKIRKNPCKKVLLAPFMLVAGEHAVHDMAGKEDSFLSRLTGLGYEAEVLLKGLGEYETIRKIYLSHLRECMGEGILYGIGVGPGDPELMTLKAARLIRECDILAIPSAEKETCVAYQIAKQAVPQIKEKPCLEIAMPMTKHRMELEKAHRIGAESIREQLEAGKNIAFLTLGDPSVYSTYRYLQEILSKWGYRSEMVSGVTSFCAAAARLGIPLGEKDEMIHIIPASYGVEEALQLKGTKVLMKAGKKLEAIRQGIQEQKEGQELGSITLYEVQNCGMQDEKIAYDAETLSGEDSYYTTLIIKNK